MSSTSQKFIARNRAPRVQIEYDVELYGAQKKVQLPFVMGVMSDLAGKSRLQQPSIDERKFLDIDVDTFDDRMQAMAPRVAFAVPNTLTGEGNLEVDLTFEKMSDFSPAAIASKVDALRPLLEARTQLANLMAYMDGKAGAESLIEKILADPSLLTALAGTDGGADHSAALDSLRALTPQQEEGTQDDTAATLDALRASAPEPATETDSAAAVLGALKSAAPTPDVPSDEIGGVLDALRSSAPEAAPSDNATTAALDSLAALDLPEEVADDTDDLLADLAADAPEEVVEEDSTSALDSLAALDLPEEVADDTDDLLAELAADAPEEVAEEDRASALDSLAALDLPEEVADATDDLLADLAAAAPEEAVEADSTSALDSLAALDLPEEVAGITDELLADLAAAAPEEAVEADSTSALDSLAALDLPEEVADATDDLLADLAADAPEEAAEESTSALDSLAALDLPEEVADDTDDLLADLAAAAPEEVDLDIVGDDLDDLLGDLGDEAPDLGAQDEEPAAQEVGSDNLDDLDDLLGDLEGTNEASSPPDEAGQGGDSGTDFDDLDDLLGDLGEDETGPAAASAASTDTDDLDDLLGDLDGDLGDDPGGDEGEAPSGATLTDDPEFAYGMLNTERPTAERLTRKRFRIAILGDFSGRAARGVIETGEALATRRATLLDPDTVEEIIENFATDLVLPLGREGGGVAVPLTGLDDLHPDELYEKVEIFSELAGLRGQLASGATTERAAQRLRDWGAAYGTPVRSPRARSGGNAVRADLKLSDFQTLIGATRPQPATPSPMDDLIARIVGPHIRALPDPDAAAMTAAVDRALSSAMRLLLHHPEFQSLEAQWRSLDLIARSIETDDTLELMLYDVSAEEIAADLATHDDLSQSGFARLLTEEPLDEETGRGGYSALIGLYSFEETPPHAELLGRIARVAAHVDAPFLAAISPGFLEVEKRDRPPLVTTAWDTLRAMPEAGHLGLLTPRVLLRRPYGAKTDPIHEFEFEEFTTQEGLSGLLWANPAVLAAILMAQSFRRNGPSMGLGSVMSLGGMPYHYVTDRYGDQVALPCTERNLTQSRVEFAMARGFMPVVSIKGRDEVRLASFQSLAGGEILGPWTGVAPPEPSPPIPVASPTSGEDGDISDLGLDGDETGDDDLDDLLSGFGDDLDPGGDEDDGGIGDMDADLAALLDDL